jgi:hypothetical protein
VELTASERRAIASKSKHRQKLRSHIAMTDTTAPSVTRLLAELHAYRVAHMAPEVLQANIDQRRHLEETADRAAWVKPGDVIEPFVLSEVLGGTVARALLAVIRRGLEPDLPSSSPAPVRRPLMHSCRTFF